jgi:mannose-6-phosphate isomerase
MGPLVFEPYLRPQIWGGRSLVDRFGKKAPADGLYGESWELSAHPLHISRVCEGPLRGASLADLYEHHKSEMFGAAAPTGKRFPLLVKLLDCNELLSVQVHPDDNGAARLAGEENGKTEAWIILASGPKGRAYLGFKPGTSRAELEARLDDGTVAECLHSFAPKPGDCLFLPAGLVHAVGGGVVMAEVQQTSDATFRLFDWNRVDATGKRRQLHREQALESIDFDMPPGRPVEPSPRRMTIANGWSETLAECPYFVLERWGWNIPGVVGLPAGRFGIWIVLAGSAQLEGDGYRRMFHAGETVVVPAVAGALQWRPTDASALLLRATLPGL